MLKSALAGGLLVALSSVPSFAVTVGFEGITKTGGYTLYDDGGFSSQGFDFKMTHGYLIDGEYWWSKYYEAQNGTDILVHDDKGSLTISAGGDAFSFASVEAGQYWGQLRTDDIVVTGIAKNGVERVQTIDSKRGFQTQYFNGWTDLVSLSFSGNGYGAYDNFVLSRDTFAAVPLPASALMLLSGLGLLGGMRLTRKS